MKINHELTRQFLGESVTPINESQGRYVDFGKILKAGKKERTKIVKQFEKDMKALDKDIDKQLVSSLKGKSGTIYLDDREDQPNIKVKNVKVIRGEPDDGPLDTEVTIEMDIGTGWRFLYSTYEDETGIFKQN
jgi:hypothetical protein